MPHTSREYGVLRHPVLWALMGWLGLVGFAKTQRVPEVAGHVPQKSHWLQGYFSEMTYKDKASMILRHTVPDLAPHMNGSHTQIMCRIWMSRVTHPKQVSANDAKFSAAHELDTHTHDVSHINESCHVSQMNESWVVSHTWESKS